jgi:transposase
MFFVGIDWAEKHLDYCITTKLGDVIQRNRVENNDDGFNTLLQLLSKEKIDLSLVAVGIESPHQRIVDFLLARGICVYPVNPTAVHDFRKSRFPSGNKSDSADAQLLADYLREHIAHLRAWRISEPELRQLKLIVEDRDKLVTQKVRLQHQLRSTLIEYFPQAVKAFSDLTSKTALEFLQQYPTFSLTQGQSEANWNQLLDECRCFHPAARQRFLDAMKEKPQQVDDAVVKAKSLFVTTIVGQLLYVVDSLKEYNQQISALLCRFSDGALFRSLPGVDTILAAKLLVNIGTDRQRFTSALELQSYFGTAPYTKSSGQYRGVHFRKACNKGMRVALSQLSFASLRCSAWANSYYSRKRKEGKKSYHALRCLANSWLKVIFAIWQNQQNYDETKHLASIALYQLNQPIVST